MNRRVYISVLLLMIGPVITFSQQLIFKNYTAQDGLIANPVTRIFQDAKGFIWIATVEGLSKYDGYKFTNFNIANGLSHNMVNDIYETPDGKLYVAENNGDIDVIQHGVIIEKAVSKNITVNRFFVAPGKRVLSGTDANGIYEFESGRLKKISQMSPQSSYGYFAQWNDSLLAGSTIESLQILNKRFDVVATITKPPFDLHCIYADSKKRLWAGTSAGLKLVSLQKNNQLQLSAPASFLNISFLLTNEIRAIHEDRDGNYWLGTSSGLIRVQPDGKWQTYSEKNGLVYNQVNCIFQDRENNIWIGTSIGLSKLVTKNNISLFTVENGLKTSTVLDLYPLNKDSLLINTKDGVQLYIQSKNKFCDIPSEKNILYSFFIKSSSPALLFSPSKKMIGVYNPVTNRIYNLDATWSYAAIKDRRNNIIGGNDNSFFLLTGETIRYDSSLPYRISCLVTDKQDYLWAGTWQNGIYRIQYSIAGNKINTSVENLTHLINAKEIRCLFADKKGNIWIGTRYNGLYCLQYSTGKNFTAKHWDYKQGLSSNWIATIAEDTNGNIWAGTFTGVDKLVKQDTGFSIFNFSRMYNLTGGSNSIITEYPDKLWITTGIGLARITDEKQEAAPPLPAYITSVSLGEEKNNSKLMNEKNISLSYRQNQAQFEFAAPGFINEKQVLYSYRLAGSEDTTWSKPANVHSVSYASLQPGHYRFEVRTLGWSGNWSAPAFFSFTIKPPFWKMAWFYIALGFALLTLLYFFSRYRIQQLVKLQKEKLKLQQVRNEQLKAQLEMEKIINFFTTSLVSKNTKEEVIRDVAKNLIHQLGFANCMIYLWNEDKTVLLQKAGYGPNGFLENLDKEQFRVELWQGIVGHAAATKKPIIVGDTSKDPRYRADVLTRYSELSVPAVYNDELIGVIDSEDFEKNYYTPQHLQILTTIATLMAAKLVTIEADEDIRRKKEEISRMNEQLAQSELASLRSQMNPHFLFNSLNSIHKYIWENKQEDASEYLTKFSKLIRMMLENSKEKTIPLSVEIEMLHLYIELEHRRCNGKFNYRLTVDNTIDTPNTAIPSMIIQPYVENAIWHGLVQKEGDGELAVSINRHNGKLECCIEDDGIGREKAQAIRESKQDKHVSLGMGITRKRIKLMDNETGETAAVVIIDKKDMNDQPCGTKVILHLPLTSLY